LDINLELKKHIKWICEGAKEALKWATGVAAGETKLTLDNRTSSANYYEAVKREQTPPPGTKPILTIKQLEDFDKHQMDFASFRNFEGLIEEFDTNLTWKKLPFENVSSARQGADDMKPLKKTLTSGNMKAVANYQTRQELRTRRRATSCSRLKLIGSIATAWLPHGMLWNTTVRLQ